MFSLATLNLTPASEELESATGLAFQFLVVADSEWIDRYRALFGDERQDYGSSLQRHYGQWPVADWEQRFVSSYASAQPWEDWAETWAHHLHMLDTLETAHARGHSLKPVKADEPSLHAVAVPTKTDSFDDTLKNWFALSYVLNSLNRSIGMPDSNPFQLSTPVLEKLEFVHNVVRAQMAKTPAPAAA